LLNGEVEHITEAQQLRPASNSRHNKVEIGSCTAWQGRKSLLKHLAFTMLELLLLPLLCLLRMCCVTSSARQEPPAAEIKHDMMAADAAARQQLLATAYKLWHALQCAGFPG
jgi:hypothetical protein